MKLTAAQRERLARVGMSEATLVEDMIALFQQTVEVGGPIADSLAEAGSRDLQTLMASTRIMLDDLTIVLFGGRLYPFNRITPGSEQVEK